MKRWYQSKLVWLGIIQLLLGIVEVMTKSPVFTARSVSFLLLIAGVLTVILRWLTTEQLVSKTEMQDRDSQPWA